MSAAGLARHAAQRDMWTKKPEGSERRGLVYFVQSMAHGRIKIGFTTDIRRRMQGLTTMHGAPLKLLRTIPGTRTTERGLHRTHAAARVCGEWFEPTDAILRLATAEAIFIPIAPSAPGMAVSLASECFVVSPEGHATDRRAVPKRRR